MYKGKYDDDMNTYNKHCVLVGYGRIRALIISKDTRMADYCQKHGKEYEMFCKDCGGKKEPMCSICMCEHIYTKHFKGVTHVSKEADEFLENLDAITPAIEAQKGKLKDYADKITGYAEEMGNIKDKLVDKHKEIIKLCTDKCSQMKGTETEMALCRDMLMREIAKCKNQLNNLSSGPEKTGSKVKQYLKEKKYWLAYKESSNFIAENIKLNDQGLKDGIKKCADEVDKYKNQLEQLVDLKDLSFQSYIELKKLNEANKGILLHCLFSSRKN